MATYNKFNDWINEELAKRNWRQADLARAAGMDTATLNRILSMERRAGPESCQAIAHAFNLPPEEVFRRAGLLPYLPEEDDMIKRITSRLRALLADRRGQTVLSQIETIVDALYKQTLGNQIAEDKQPCGNNEK